MGISGMGKSGMGISGISIRMGNGNSGSGSFVSRPPFAGLSSNEAGDGSSERVDTSSGNYFRNEFFDFNGDFFDNVFVLHGLVNKAMAIEGISAISQVMVRQGG